MYDLVAGSNTEVWRPVVGYEGWYEVSSLGRVKSLVTRGGKPQQRILKPRRHTGGYTRVHIGRNGIYKDHLIHRMVMQAFVGCCPNGIVVNHINGKKTDNRMVNLEYVTYRQNSRHAHSLGLTPAGTDHPNSSITDTDVRFIRDARYKIEALELAARFGVSRGTIYRIQLGKRYRNVI